ncbi:uncharacterized protein [Rhodnius prolixus]|uniref:uncharacterized protein n=1 Tax=Rhodnius prolixus TaxID=13249 RepID=UPI003D18D472
MVTVMEVNKDLSHTGLPCLDLEKPDIGNQWQRWKRVFQIFIDAKGITEPGRQKALLLHCAGMAVQDIYFSLPEEKIKLPPLPETASAQELKKREKVEYQMAIEALEEHFQPKVNVTYERHVFRGMRQEREENMNNFIARLRKQAQNCDFQKQVEDQIKDQVISTCYSSELRREFLHKSEITLAEIEKLSKTFEAVAIHSKALDGEEAQCNRVIMKRPQKKFYKVRDKQTSSKINTNVCYRCGRAGHFWNDPSCPARDKICNKCKLKGHFAGMCHTHLKKRKPHISQIQTKEAPSSDSGVQVAIPLKPDVQPVQQPYRRVPASIRKQVEKKVEELLEMGIIEPVQEYSPWSSPLVPVVKPNGEIRLCVDFRRVNEAILVEKHPIPTIDDFLPQLTGSKIYTLLDLKNAYHQVELAPESRPLTTFQTPKGMYRFKRLPMGLSSAAEKFQKIMEQILRNCDGVGVCIDDVLIYGIDKNQLEHRVKEVLRILEENGLELNKSKCKFSQKEVVFLGHKLTEEGIRAAENKVEAVQNFREPRTASEVKVS